MASSPSKQKDRNMSIPSQEDMPTLIPQPTPIEKSTDHKSKQPYVEDVDESDNSSSSIQNLSLAKTTESRPQNTTPKQPTQPQTIVLDSAGHRMTEIMQPNPKDFSYGYHLLHLAEQKPPTPASTHLAVILRTELRTTIAPKFGIPLAVALSTIKDAKLFIPFAEAEAKYICIHMDYTLYLRDHPTTEEKESGSESLEEFLRTGTRLKERWGEKFMTRLQDSVNGFGERATKALSMKLRKIRKDPSESYPQMLRFYIRGQVVKKGKESLLYRRLGKLLQCEDPQFEDPHFVFLTRVLEMVDPSGILTPLVTIPTPEMSADLISAFGALAVEFIEQFLKEGMSVVLKLSEKKIIVAKRNLKKFQAKLDKAEEKARRADGESDMKSEGLDAEKDLLVVAEKRKQLAEELNKKRESLDVAKLLLMVAEREKSEVEKWLGVLEEQVKTFAKIEVAIESKSLGSQSEDNTELEGSKEDESTDKVVVSPSVTMEQL